MGGHDIYSCSKGAAEIVTSSWRRSFFSPKEGIPSGVYVATCRAGNVIGGGDWSRDRIVADSMRALSRNESIEVRNPLSIRPWQHVLEPLSGYLTLASLLHARGAQDSELASSWNFGPGRESERTVGDLCDAIVEYWGTGAWHHNKEFQPVHEARFLKLAIDKAWHYLGWKPVWDFRKTVEETVSWYREALDSNLAGDRMRAITQAQIQRYAGDGATRSVRWAAP